MDNSDFLFLLEQELGTIHACTELSPGVYTVTILDESGDFPYSREFYVIAKNTAEISAKAKRYGKPCPTAPDLLLYDREQPDSGWRIIEFEVRRLNCEKSGDTALQLRESAAFGREFHPEYFGAYPVPYRTPYGYNIRYTGLAQGVYWIETDTLQNALCIYDPILEDLSEYSKNISSKAIREPQGCLFFPERDACVPLFELMQKHPEWESSGIIDGVALMNAVCYFHPEYMFNYNNAIQSGAGDTFGLLLNAIGVKKELETVSELMLTLSPDTSKQYLHLDMA